MKRLDNGDGLAAAVSLNPAVGKRNLIEAVRVANLSRGEDRQKVAGFELFQMQMNRSHGLSPLLACVAQSRAHSERSEDDSSVRNGASVDFVTFRIHAKPTAEDVSIRRVEKRLDGNQAGALQSASPIQVIGAQRGRESFSGRRT